MYKKILATAAALTIIAAPAAAIAAGSGDDSSARAGHHGTVTGRDVVDGSLSGRDIKDSSVRLKDLSSGVQYKLRSTTTVGAITRVAATGLDANANDTTYMFSVACPAGTAVIGGGAWALSPGASLQGTRPGSTSDAQANAWTGAAVKDASAPAALAVEAFALCQATS